jgi:Mg-chelatase subunit ChlD
MKNAVKSLNVGGSTNMTQAIEIAYTDLIDKSGLCVIVLLTDGYPDNSSSSLKIAQACKTENIEIIAIGTDGADQKFMKKLATRDEGQFFASAKDIEATFGKIARNLSEYKGALGFNR